MSRSLLVLATGLMLSLFVTALQANDPPARPPGDKPATRPFRLGVDMNYALQMQRDGRKWTHDGKAIDPYSGLARQGVNAARVRLWTGDEGESGLHYAVDVANRARDNGLAPYLVLFLSENWADMVKQPAPAVWKDLDEPAKLAAIEAYAERVTRHFSRHGHDIDLFEIGNEIDFGICGVFEEEWPKRVSIEYMSQRIWPRMTPILTAAQRGVRKARPNARFILHLAQWQEHAYCVAFWKHMIDAGVAVDVAGISYFPTSAEDPARRTLAYFDQTLTAIHEAIRRPVIVCETAYPSSAKFDGQFSAWNKPIEGYDLSAAGQGKWVADFLAIARRNRALEGVYYWSPEWYASGPVNWTPFAMFDEEGIARPAFGAFTAQPPESNPRPGR
ncbi:glycosyl hydrolase 53 family protein [Humisphaera borealis]|uniref:Arabinogalactan endo-beta-1,4-galactanase n=1 Tax=Humisphaera borealis TaxID=2807512 RepID=A0A7M2WV71_9BACT|nr:glycosyl hydrolase 53 family protein [Humisphaera borealis]QOV89122.1 glycosyl hydrolase 53 family protein [Humisphaera borealis]